MKVVIDVEANALHNPSKIWVIVCKDIDTGKHYVFRKPTEDVGERKSLCDFWSGISLIIGHNYLGYDWPVLERLLGLAYKPCLDTLILSKLIDYPRQGHSIEDYGLGFNYPKIKFTDFSKWSQELEDIAEYVPYVMV